MVVALHERIHSVVPLLCVCQAVPNQLKTLLLVRLVEVARLVLLETVVLDLLAFVFDFGETESRRRTLQEVAKLRQLFEILVFPSRV